MPLAVSVYKHRLVFLLPVHVPKPFFQTKNVQKKAKKKTNQQTKHTHTTHTNQYVKLNEKSLPGRIICISIVRRHFLLKSAHDV